MQNLNTSNVIIQQYNVRRQREIQGYLNTSNVIIQHALQDWLANYKLFKYI